MVATIDAWRYPSNLAPDLVTRLSMIHTTARRIMTNGVTPCYVCSLGVSKRAGPKMTMLCGLTAALWHHFPIFRGALPFLRYEPCFSPVAVTKRQECLFSYACLTSFSAMFVFWLSGMN